MSGVESVTQEKIIILKVANNSFKNLYIWYIWEQFYKWNDIHNWALNTCEVECVWIYSE